MLDNERYVHLPACNHHADRGLAVCRRLPAGVAWRRLGYQWSRYNVSLPGGIERHSSVPSPYRTRISALLSGAFCTLTCHRP